jgi:hypothetical protein
MQMVSPACKKGNDETRDILNTDRRKNGLFDGAHVSTHLKNAAVFMAGALLQNCEGVWVVADAQPVNAVSRGPIKICKHFKKLFKAGWGSQPTESFMLGAQELTCKPDGTSSILR